MVIEEILPGNIIALSNIFLVALKTTIHHFSFWTLNYYYINGNVTSFEDKLFFLAIFSLHMSIVTMQIGIIVNLASADTKAQ